MGESREKLYRDLVESRKTCFLCKDELCNPSKVHGYSKFDKEIGPWSRWQGNLHADIMIVGQDWGNVRLLQNNYLESGREVKSNRTDINLREMLDKALGVPIDWELRGKYGKFFFTNAVLCLRCGDKPMQGNAKSVWFKNCVIEKKFLRRQIEIVNPKVVVGLGRLAFNSILKSFDLEPSKKS